MKLPFGVNNGQYIHISEVDSGKTTLRCPYCNGALIAKKGRIKRHHFAHVGKGCTQHFASHFFDLVGRLPTPLPLSVYAQQKLAKIDQFYRQLKTQQAAQQPAYAQQKLAELAAILTKIGKHPHEGNIPEIQAQIDRFVRQKIAPFPAFHTLRSPFFQEGYTDGKRTCSINEVDAQPHEFYYPIALQSAVEFLQNYHQNEYEKREIVDKLVLFEKDLAYFHQFQLYFLEIIVDHQKIYKIGLTSRPIEQRLTEIEKDLKAFYLSAQITVLFQHKGVAFLETFFKHTYSQQQYKIGQLTEYFSFTNAALSLILRDLNLLTFIGMPPRNDPAWIDWVYFNFTGKIYGYRQKSVYVAGAKFVLSEEEEQLLNELRVLQAR